MMNRRELLAGIGATVAITTLPAPGMTAETPHSWKRDAGLVKLIEEIKASAAPLLHSGLFECNTGSRRQRFRKHGHKMLHEHGHRMLHEATTKKIIYDYRVVCDKTNNPPEVIAGGNFIIDYYIKVIDGRIVWMRFNMNPSKPRTDTYVAALVEL